MGAKDKTDKVLRDIHVLFSKAEPYEGSRRKVVVDKSEMMELLKELNDCCYEMQEEYQLTVQSKEKANRELQKQGDEIRFEAQRRAEDVYGASMLYTDEVLATVYDIMKDATMQMQKIYGETEGKLKAQQEKVRLNQTEVRNKLEKCISSEKYLKLIDEENERRRREKEKQKQAKARVKAMDAAAESESQASDKPEIKINRDFFEQQGYEAPPAMDEEKSEVKAPQNILEITPEQLDKEYMDWKNEGAAETEEEKRGFGLFSKKK